MDLKKLPYKNLIIFLNECKIEKDEFEKEYAAWLEINFEKPFSDFMWPYFEKTAVKKAKEAKSQTELYQNMRFIYFEMVFYKILVEEEKPGILLTQAHHYELLAAQSTQLKMNVSIIGRADCSKCADIKNQIPIEREIKNRGYLSSDAH